MKKPIFIIAEIGINHNGDIKLCKELIDIAKAAGCNAIKLQKRNITKVFSEKFLNTYRESPWGFTQKDQKLGLEFNLEKYKEIDRYCKYKNIEWFASAWDLDSQKFLRNFDLKYNKIASAMITYIDLLEMVASEKKYTFISTGMSNYSDIDKAVNIFRKNSCPFELMHTISTYPMRDQDANLNTIKTLREKYNCNVGYSGHESGLAVSYAAAAMNITSLERHITLSKSLYGSDQAASLEPGELRSLVRAVRSIELAMGDGQKKILESEVPISVKLRAHIPKNKSVKSK